MKCFICIVTITNYMNEYLYELFGDVFLTDFSIDDADFKRTVDLGKYGKLETYSLFPGII